MTMPYEILDINDFADDEQIKKAYLTKVRQHPPERDPEGFRRVRAAYESIRTRKDRMAYRLFHHGQPDLKVLADKWLTGNDVKRPSEKLITDLLATSAKQIRIDMG